MLEAEGLATVALSQVRGQSQRLHPPRVLHCEFPLGRPLGKPGDPSFQRRVIDAAFALLDRRSGPVWEEFPESITDESEAPLACSLPPRVAPSLHEAVDEVDGLRAAYERNLASTGRTLVGRVIGVDQMRDAVVAFVRIADGAPWNEAGLPADPVSTAMDVRAYYEEVALALAGHVPAARAAESWFYRKTATGRIMKRAQASMKAAGAPALLWFSLLPVGQQ